MPTIDLMASRSLSGAGHTQTPEETSDLDGFKEVSLYFKIVNWVSGSSTLTVTVGHAARNRRADVGMLVSLPFTSAGSTFSYQTQFSRFLPVSADFANPSNMTNSADVEVLAVPKR